MILGYRVYDENDTEMHTPFETKREAIEYAIRAAKEFPWMKRISITETREIWNYNKG